MKCPAKEQERPKQEKIGKRTIKELKQRSGEAEEEKKGRKKMDK